MTSASTEQDKTADETREKASNSNDNDSSSSETRHKTTRIVMTGDKDDDKTIVSVSSSPSGRVTHVRQLFVGNVRSVTIIF